MVKKNKTNIYLSGFSLFEACVVMLIVAVFIAMCANAYTKRHVTYQESDGHGRYECYYKGGQLVQRYVENNSARNNVGGTTCVFRPPRYAKYLLINAIGGGAGADAAGEFVSLFYNAIDQPLTIDPGKANESTVIKDAAGNSIYEAKAGTGEMSVTNSAADRVGNCTVGNGIDTDGKPLNFDCSESTSICAQDGTNLVVYYCKADQSFQRIDIPIAEVKANRRSYSGNTINYEDLQDYINVGHMDAADALAMIRNGQRPYNSYFTLTVEFDMSTSKKSQMVDYLNLLGIEGEDTIQEIGPGEPGKPGGVVILW